jgi:hypothetical protein
MPDTSTNHFARNRGVKEMEAEGAKNEQRVMNGPADMNGNSGGKEELEKGKEKEKRTSVLGKAWKKLDLDVPTALMMIK